MSENAGGGALRTGAIFSMGMADMMEADEGEEQEGGGVRCVERVDVLIKVLEGQKKTTQCCRLLQLRRWSGFFRSTDAGPAKQITISRSRTWAVAGHPTSFTLPVLHSHPTAPGAAVFSFIPSPVPRLSRSAYIMLALARPPGPRDRRSG
jgi:hypothetical protein